MLKGELNRLCKDFEVTVPLSKQMNIFNKESVNQEPLILDQFKQALPLLGMEMATAKTQEIKHRLKEIKNVLEYPENKFAITDQIEIIINGIE